MKSTRVNFPEKSTEKSIILQELDKLLENDIKWKEGKIFGYVFNPGDEITNFLEQTYQKCAHLNRLNPTCFPSLKTMETEIVSMCADFLHGDASVTGNATSGGTESIILSVLVAREMGKETHPSGFQPEIVLPSTAHPAFLKACHYLNVLPRIVPVREDKRADPVKTAQAINDRTVMLVVSAPCFPYGVIDPVEEFSQIALQRNILLHVDACMGGFMLPFMNDAGYPVPPFDFSVPGVTSLSLDPHKYGYSMKGVSVILYRNPEMRKKQFFVCTDWPGGIFASTGLMGTRSGGPLASAWAMIKLTGKEGYIKMARDVMEAGDKLKSAVLAIPGLKIISNPDMSILAINSDEFDILYIADLLAKKGWHLDRQQLPDSLHFTVSAGNIRVMDDFIADLREVLHHTRKLKMENRLKKIFLRGAQRISNAIPGTTIGRMASLFALKQNKKRKNHSSGQAAFYGLTGSLPDREKLSDAVLELLDGMYR